MSEAAKVESGKLKAESLNPEEEMHDFCAGVWRRIARGRAGVRTWRKADSGKLKVESELPHLRGCPPERDDQ